MLQVSFDVTDQGIVPQHALIDRAKAGVIDVEPVEVAVEAQGYRSGFGAGRARGRWRPARSGSAAGRRGRACSWWSQSLAATRRRRGLVSEGPAAAGTLACGATVAMVRHLDRQAFKQGDGG